jgi:hypothetical protein
MSKLSKFSLQENISYLIVWGLLFTAPILSLYVRTISDSDVTFNWTEVFMVWRNFAIYLFLFLIHNFLLAPLLVHQRRHVLYFSIVAVVIAAFTTYQCSSRPDINGPAGNRHAMEQPGRHEPPHHDEPPMGFGDERPPFDEPPPPQMRPHDVPRPGLGEREIMSVVMLILMFGANLGIKGYFRSRDDRKRLAELERQNLEQQLEYLRYQINPHFFMNTLNNIHALVDIDPEKAKDTILELSNMMRFVLYEGNKQGVLLSRELDFIRHYVTLMQLRYTEKVKITLNLPKEVPFRQIPPLVLITFIENAFKHGVSYQQESFIEIRVTVENERLLFDCRNSKAETTKRPNDQATPPQQGGIGLSNVRKRLDLLYGTSYALHINDDTQVYSVQLTLPL